MALSAATLYVVNKGTGTNTGSVGEYDANTGAPINASLITGLQFPTTVAVVPEPASIALLAFGSVALLGLVRRRSA